MITGTKDMNNNFPPASSHAGGLSSSQPEELTPAAPSQTWRSSGCGPERGERWGCRPTAPSLPEDPPSALWGWKHLRTPQSGSPRGWGSEGQRGWSSAQLHGEKSRFRMSTLAIRTATRKTLNKTTPWPDICFSHCFCLVMCRHLWNVYRKTPF